MNASTSMVGLLAEGDDEAIAIGATEGVAPLRYRALRDLARRTVERLNSFGIGRNDRVAIVLPNGPEMAAAFVCIASGATTAPLNPAYRAEEFEFYLTDLRAKALVVEAGADSPARAVAQKLEIPVVELHSDRDAGCGLRSRSSRSSAMGGRPGQGGFADAGDIALVLHTSGHDLAAEDRAAPATQRARHAHATSAPRSRSSAATSASTSCRCSTSTA